MENSETKKSSQEELQLKLNKLVAKGMKAKLKGNLKKYNAVQVKIKKLSSELDKQEDANMEKEAEAHKAFDDQYKFVQSQRKRNHSDMDQTFMNQLLASKKKFVGASGDHDEDGKELMQEVSASQSNRSQKIFNEQQREYLKKNVQADIVRDFLHYRNEKFRSSAVIKIYEHWFLSVDVDSMKSHFREVKAGGVEIKFVLKIISIEACRSITNCSQQALEDLETIRHALLDNCEKQGMEMIVFESYLDKHKLQHSVLQVVLYTRSLDAADASSLPDEDTADAVDLRSSFLYNLKETGSEWSANHKLIFLNDTARSQSKPVPRQLLWRFSHLQQKVPSNFSYFFVGVKETGCAKVIDDPTQFDQHFAFQTIKGTFGFEAGIMPSHASKHEDHAAANRFQKLFL